MRDIACGSWRYRCGVFKIEILKLGGSFLAAEICAEHNRLLRRQHCSSLCSQSEGHEHIANMVSALGHNLVGFSTRACPPNIRSPLLRRQHCSSLCSQSEGHEHIANMVSVLGHYFVGFSARAWPPQYSSPSLCKQSELQCFASAFRRMSAHHPLLRHHANTDCQRTREQTQPLLGAETNASGSRDERRWDGVQLCLLLRALTVVRTGFTEVGIYQW